MLSTVVKAKSLKQIKYLKHLHLLLRLICQSVSPLGSPLTFRPTPVVRRMHSMYLTTGRSSTMIHLILPQNQVRRDVYSYKIFVSMFLLLTVVGGDHLHNTLCSECNTGCGKLSIAHGRHYCTGIRTKVLQSIS